MGRIGATTEDLLLLQVSTEVIDWEEGFRVEDDKERVERKRKERMGMLENSLSNIRLGQCIHGHEHVLQTRERASQSQKGVIACLVAKDENSTTTWLYPRFHFILGLPSLTPGMK